MKKSILIFVSIFFFNYAFANIDIYFFYWISCPYCAVQKEYFQELNEKYNFNIKEYEIYQNKDNLILMWRFADVYKWNFNGVPITIIWNDYFLWADKNKTENLLKKYSANPNYPNPYNIVLNYEAKNKEEIVEDKNNQNSLPIEKYIEEENINLENKVENIEKSKKTYNCVSPWWKTINHKDYVIAYKSEIWFTDKPCLQETRTCNDWKLNWEYTYQNCTQKDITQHENENRKLEKSQNINKDKKNSILEKTWTIKTNWENPTLKNQKNIKKTTILVSIWVVFLITMSYSIIKKWKK